MKGAKVEAGEVLEAAGLAAPGKETNRGLSVMDFFLRIIAATGTLGSALAMGTAKQTLRFATRFVRFRAEFDDLPTFVFFVTTNSVVCIYLVFSLALSFFHIIRSTAVKSRVVLIFLDTVMFGLLTTAAAAAAGIVYVPHKGNPGVNWFPICLEYKNFCMRISGSVVGSFVAVVIFMILICMSAVSITRR